VGVTTVAVGRTTASVGAKTGVATSEQADSKNVRSGKNFFMPIIIVFGGL
jgi:hypothetical protein